MAGAGGKWVVYLAVQRAINITDVSLRLRPMVSGKIFWAKFFYEMTRFLLQKRILHRKQICSRYRMPDPSHVCPTTKVKTDAGRQPTEPSSLCRSFQRHPPLTPPSLDLLHVRARGQAFVGLQPDRSQQNWVDSNVTVNRVGLI